MRILIVLATLATAWTLAPASQGVTRASTRASVFPAGGNIPADHVRLRYVPASRLGYTDTRLPRLYRLEGNIKVNVPYDSEIGTLGVWITPTIEQPLGTQLVLEADGCDADAPLRVTYSITEKRPTLPSALGTLSAASQRALIAVEDGVCSEVADVTYADLSIALSDEALPFSALWHYQLYIDDEPHVLDSPTKRIYAQCSDVDANVPNATAVQPGAHALHFAAQLGDEAPIVTPDVQLELRCDGPPSATREPVRSPSDA